MDSDDHNNNDLPPSTPALHLLPLEILTEIVSYLPIQDYRDLAHLRLISKNVQGTLPNLLKMIGRLDCSYGGTTRGYWDGLFDLVEDDYDSYSCNYSGLMLDFVNQTKNMQRHMDHEDAPKVRKAMSLFDGFEVQHIMIVMEEAEWQSMNDLEEYYTSFSSSTVCIENDEHYQDFSLLCHEIVSTSTQSFQQQCLPLAREAAKKGIFLPVALSYDQENNKLYDPQDPENDETQTHLIIATLSIPFKDFQESSIHYCDGDKYYLRMISEEEQKKKQEDFRKHGYPMRRTAELENSFSPRNQDLSRIFRAYPVENAGEEEVTITVKVPLAVCDLSEEGDSMLQGMEWCGELLPAEQIVRFHENKGVIEGIAIADSIIPPNLHQNLKQQIDALADSQTVIDYHPHSNNIVRDLVHPALYSFIKGVSKVVKSEDEVDACLWSGDQEPPKFKTKIVSIGPRNIQTVQYQEDYWGREYEASLKYQWLPTYFDIGSDGSCTICDYINNLAPREKYSDLYSLLESLFSYSIPLLESSYTYGRKIRKYLRGPDKYRERYNEEYPSKLYDAAYFKDGHYSLKGKKLQVITKIVDYELDDDKSYEGVWHVEGMSHEEIVATCIYVLERDEDLVGADILFKRAIHGNEAFYMEETSSGQSRPNFIGRVGEAGEIPLGKVEMLKGRMVAFPNSHIHKVSKLEKKPSNITIQDSGDNDKMSEGHFLKKQKLMYKRRIVVFFLVNPMKRIISTREVPPQQVDAGGDLSLEDALEHRLELMKERKYAKQDFNIREINLCEH